MCSFSTTIPLFCKNDFLSDLEQAFAANPYADAIMPLGKAAFCEWPGGYDFHDPHFPTSRCTAYRRSVLEELGGFMSSFVGQEDVEFVLRFTLKGKRRLPLPAPDLFSSPVAGAQSAETCGGGYLLRPAAGPVFDLDALAGCPELQPSCALLLSWKRHHREMGRFGLGFLRGFLKAWFQPEAQARYG